MQISSNNIENFLITKRTSYLVKSSAILTQLQKVNKGESLQALHSPFDYLNTIHFSENQSNKVIKILTSRIKKLGTLLSVCRSRNYSEKEKTTAMEETICKIVGVYITAYNQVLKKQHGIYKKLWTVKFSDKKITPFFSWAIKKYLRVYLKGTKTKYDFFKEKQLRTWIAVEYKKRYRFLSRTKYRRLMRRFQIKAGQSSRTIKSTFPIYATKIGAVASFLPTTPEYSYTLQFIIGLLPELCLTAMLVAVLTVIALQLETTKNKRVWTLKSLSAFRLGLFFIAFLYLIQVKVLVTVELFNGYALTSAYTAVLKLLTLLSSGVILGNSIGYIRTHRKHLLEYPLVLMLALIFMLLLIGSGNLISAFLSLVGFSLNLYVLVLFDATIAISREAGVKYFYLSTVSSGLIAYGIFIIFLITGTGNLLETGQILATDCDRVSSALNLLQLAISLLLTGFFFKLSAFPGHLWAAEVYEGSPDPVTAFFMLPVKVSVIAFVIQLLITALEPATFFWQPLIMLSAVISLFWGCFAALVEKKIKRFLAYASINQIGFLLLGLATGSFEGYRTTLFYLLIYAIMNIGFLLFFLNTTQVDKQFGLRYLVDFRGFGYDKRGYSWPIAMILLAMAGIPPLAGFFGKYFLLLHAQEQELYGMVGAGLFTSLISTYYYLRIIKTMWFEPKWKSSSTRCLLSTSNITLLYMTEWLLWGFLLYTGSILRHLSTITMVVWSSYQR
jgi:NADH-quinone oxidoreductase subunit N